MLKWLNSQSKWIGFDWIGLDWIGTARERHPRIFLDRLYFAVTAPSQIDAASSYYSILQRHRRILELACITVNKHPSNHLDLDS
jgi:hypothetical protein